MTNQKNTYIFPTKVAHTMASATPKIQYEASMMGTVTMMLGLIITVTYFIFYFDFAVWYKIVLIINALAGLVVMGAMVTTTYQQYLAYMNAVQLIEETTGIKQDLPAFDKVRKMREGAGIILIAGSILTIVGVAFFMKEKNLSIAIIIVCLLIFVRGIWLVQEQKTKDFYFKRYGIKIE